MQPGLEIALKGKTAERGSCITGNSGARRTPINGKDQLTDGLSCAWSLKTRSMLGAPGRKKSIRGWIVGSHKENLLGSGREVAWAKAFLNGYQK